MVPHRCKAASREGGQFVTTPNCSPRIANIWAPSGFGWFGSGCWTYDYEKIYSYHVNSIPCVHLCNQENKLPLQNVLKTVIYKKVLRSNREIQQNNLLLTLTQIKQLMHFRNERSLFLHKFYKKVKKLLRQHAYIYLQKSKPLFILKERWRIFFSWKKWSNEMICRTTDKNVL